MIAHGAHVKERAMGWHGRVLGHETIPGVGEVVVVHWDPRPNGRGDYTAFVALASMLDPISVEEGVSE